MPHHLSLTEVGNDLASATWGPDSLSSWRSTCRPSWPTTPPATPGSDDQLSFYEKTVSREVLDALQIIAYLRSMHDLPVHVVGISTGAIVAEL